MSKSPLHLVTAPPYLQLDNGAGTRVDHLFRTLLRHFLAHGKEQEQLLRAYLTVLLAEAQDLYVGAPVETIDNAATQLRKAFRRAVERHYIERKQVQDYADLLGVTANHLVKTVRETTGATPGQIIQDRLLLEAKRLLAHSHASISDISQQLAFQGHRNLGVGLSMRQAYHRANFVWALFTSTNVLANSARTSAGSPSRANLCSSHHPKLRYVKDKKILVHEDTRSAGFFFVKLSKEASQMRFYLI